MGVARVQRDSVQREQTSQHTGCTGHVSMGYVCGELSSARCTELARTFAAGRRQGHALLVTGNICEDPVSYDSTASLRLEA